MMKSSRQLIDYIFNYQDVLPQESHKKLLDLCDSFEWPEYDNCREDNLYNLHGYRSHKLLSEDDGEIYGLIHRAMMRVMPKIYKDYSVINPPDSPEYDKYSGYWLCKYPENGYLSIHTDADGDAGSVTASYNINDNYEGGEICFWGDTNLDKHSNSIHVYPSNLLYPHEVKPVTKGTRYSVIVWLSYQKGQPWI